MEKVILGFSGGVDSTAAAIMLREAGYDVRLLTLNTTGSTELLSKARQQAEQLGLPWESRDVREAFRQEIVGYFIDGYRRGETPAPCTVCNPRIKWRILYETMKERGYDHIATGHYVRITYSEGLYFVSKGIDPVKDQSYYLWGLPQPYLQYALTPLGNHLKSDIKQTYHQPTPQRESMGVCFLAGRSCADFLRTHLPGLSPGEVVDEQGRVIGRHDGYALYTIGQKKGLHTDFPGFAVTGIDASSNRLVAGPSEKLLHRNLILRDCQITDPQTLIACSRLEVKIRGIGHNPGGYARITRQTASGLHIRLAEPARAATKGQPVVLYEDDRVLGGGFLAGYF